MNKNKCSVVGVSTFSASPCLTFRQYSNLYISGAKKEKPKFKSANAISGSHKLTGALVK